MLSHTHAHSVVAAALCDMQCVVSDETFHSHTRLGNRDTALTQVIISWSKQVENLQQNRSLDCALTPSAPPYTMEGSHQPPVEEGYTRLSAHLPVPGYTFRVRTVWGQEHQSPAAGGRDKAEGRGGTLTSRARTHAQLPEPILSASPCYPSSSSQPSEPATRVMWGPEGPDEALSSTASQGRTPGQPRGLALGKQLQPMPPAPGSPGRQPVEVSVGEGRT